MAESRALYVIVDSESNRPSSPIEGTIVTCSDTDKTYRWNGTSWVEIGGSSGSSTVDVLDIVSSTNTISNTVTPTDTYSFTIPGGTLGANDRLDLRLESFYTNNTGSNRGVAMKVKLGSTTAIDFDPGSVWSSSSSPRGMSIRISVQAKGSTSSQLVFFEVCSAGTTGGFGTIAAGNGQRMTSSNGWMYLYSDPVSVDMTSNATLHVEITLSSAATTHKWITYSSCLEIKRA